MAEIDRNKDPAETYLANGAAELNAMAERYGLGERITQEQFSAAMQNVQRTRQLQQSGRYRILGVDTWELGSDRIAGDYDSLDDALHAAYWEAWSGRQFWSYAEKGIRSQEMPDEIRHSGRSEMPQYFLDNFGHYREEVLAGTPRTSEKLYVYDPQGNFIEEISV